MCPKLIELLSGNDPTVNVCCFLLAHPSTKTFVRRIHIRQPSPKYSEKNLRQPKNSLAGSLVSRGIAVLTVVLQLPTVFSTVTCCTGLQPRSNRLYHIAEMFSRLHCTIQVCVGTRSRLTTHFSKSIPVVKRRISEMQMNQPTAK